VPLPWRAKPWCPRAVGVIPVLRLCDAFGDPQLHTLIFDPAHPYNHIAATIHRFGRDMPMSFDWRVYDFQCFSRQFITRYFNPIAQADIPTFMEWLRGSSYSWHRKRRLLKLYMELMANGLDDRIFNSKSFIKWEGYLKAKHPRAINSPSDASKVVIGPIMWAVDKAVFKLKWFVKGSDPRTWPARLQEAFGQSPVMETDFSSFEAHHRGAFSEIGWFWVNHMMSACGRPAEFMVLVERMMLGQNTSVFPTIITKVDQRLMSGAMWTSSANGVLNLLIMAYLNARTVFPNAPVSDLVRDVDQYFTGFVEGDDGICISRNVNQELISDLGLDLKFDTAHWYGDASFCGIVCDPIAQTVVTDPLKVVRNFFVLPSSQRDSRDNKHRALLRAKALSYKYAFNDCPIVGALCHRVCDETRGVTVDLSELEEHKRVRCEQAVRERMWDRPPCVPYSSRLLVERMYGVPVAHQLRIEASIMTGRGDHIQADFSFARTDMDVTLDDFVGDEDILRVPLPPTPYVSDVVVGAWKHGIRGKTQLKAVHRKYLRGKCAVPFDITAALAALDQDITYQ
jgi:hypothetical protein